MDDIIARRRAEQTEQGEESSDEEFGGISEDSENGNDRMSSDELLQGSFTSDVLTTFDFISCPLSQNPTLQTA